MGGLRDVYCPPCNYRDHFDNDIDRPLLRALLPRLSSSVHAPSTQPQLLPDRPAHMDLLPAADHPADIRMGPVRRGSAQHQVNKSSSSRLLHTSNPAHPFVSMYFSCSVNWDSHEPNATSYIVYLFIFGLIVPLAVILYSYINIIRTMKQVFETCTSSYAPPGTIEIDSAFRTPFGWAASTRPSQRSR